MLAIYPNLDPLLVYVTDHIKHLLRYWRLETKRSDEEGREPDSK